MSRIPSIIHSQSRSSLQQLWRHHTTGCRAVAREGRRKRWRGSTLKLKDIRVALKVREWQRCWSVPRQWAACCSPAPYTPSSLPSEHHPGCRLGSDPGEKQKQFNQESTSAWLASQIFRNNTLFSAVPLLWWTVLWARVLKPLDFQPEWMEFYLGKEEKAREDGKTKKAENVGRQKSESLNFKLTYIVNNM